MFRLTPPKPKFKVLGLSELLVIPAPAPNLALWFKADSGVVLDKTSGITTVSQWLDQSGSDNHAIQPIKTRQPTLINSSVNGLPAIRFVDGFLTCPLVNTSDKLEVFVVFKRLGNGLSSPYLGLFSVATDATDDQILITNAAVFLDISSNFGGYRADHPMSMTSSRVDNVGAVASTYYNGTLNVLTYNNVESAAQTISGNFNYNKGYIGRRQEVGTTQIYNGEMCELLVYHRELTAAERQKTNNYLKLKYNL